MKRRLTDLVLLVLPLGVGAVGSAATIRALPIWYRTLDKPSWTPPDRAFGPVWTTLYLLMGLALVLVHRAGARDAHRHSSGEGVGEVRSGDRARALRIFGIQLGLNLAWSLIFFGVRAIRAAGVEIVVLWASIAATIAAFWRVRPIAAVLLIPYLAWTSLATALNLEIWRRNA